MGSGCVRRGVRVLAELEIGALVVGAYKEAEAL